MDVSKKPPQEHNENSRTLSRPDDSRIKPKIHLQESNYTQRVDLEQQPPVSSIDENLQGWPENDERTASPHRTPKRLRITRGRGRSTPNERTNAVGDKTGTENGVLTGADQILGGKKSLSRPLYCAPCGDQRKTDERETCRAWDLGGAKSKTERRPRTTRLRRPNQREKSHTDEGFKRISQCGPSG
jgi:hypothetical protein